MTWSYSRLKSFEDCPYKWYLSYILEEKEAPMFYASYGSFIHRLLEQYYSGEITENELLFAFLSRFQAEVKGRRPPEQTVQKYIASGADYFRNFRPFPFITRGVEERLHFDLDGTKFVAVLDYVGERDGKLVLVDNKSRELKPRSGRKKPTANDRELDSMLRQLYLYAHGMKQVYGEFPDVLCFNCFKNGQFIEEPFDSMAYDDALDWARGKIDEIADEEDFLPYVDWFFCKNICGFHDDCCYFQGR